MVTKGALELSAGFWKMCCEVCGVAAGDAGPEGHPFFFSRLSAAFSFF